MEENNTPDTLNVEEHTKNLQTQMVLLAERHVDGKLSESDTALYLALVSSSVLMTNLYQQLDTVGKTVQAQADTIKTLLDSQKLMVELLQRWNGIDVSDALPTVGESDHG